MDKQTFSLREPLHKGALLPPARTPAEAPHSHPTIHVGYLAEEPLTEPTHFSCGRSERLVVFPQRGAWIGTPTSQCLMADINSIVLCGPGTHFWPKALIPQGEGSLWLAVRWGTPSSTTVRKDACSTETAPTLPQRLELDDRLFLRQSVLTNLARQGTTSLDGLAQAFRDIATKAVDLASGANTPSSPSSALAEQARFLMATAPWQAWSLQELASRLECSPCHLSRSFKRAFGFGISIYRKRMRLRLSAQMILEGAPDLLTVALQVGYQTHAHFSADFHQAFGIVPSGLRSLAGVEQVPISSESRSPW